MYHKLNWFRLVSTLFTIGYVTYLGMYLINMDHINAKLLFSSHTFVL